MIIKVNYTVSDIYMSTSVSAVYIKVVYSGVSAGGGGTWGTITGTLSAQTDLQTALDLKLPYTGATGAVNLGAFGITAASLIKSGGTSAQFLKADGSVDSSTYTPTSRTLTINGTTQDLSADRTFTIATANIYNADGTLTSARTLTSGGFPLTFTGTNTAASLIARGLNLTHTLVASANNDVLVGLDINPTFTNGAFTGVTNTGLRVQGINIGLGNGALATNTAIGFKSLNGANSGNGSNTSIGYQAGFSNTTGYNNTYLGYQAGYTNLTNDSNVAIGYQAGYLNTSYCLTAIGVEALRNSTGFFNTAIGFQAGFGITTGLFNTLIGGQIMTSTTTATDCTIIGYRAARNNTGSNNTVMGSNALNANTTGSGNLVFGSSAFSFNTTGSSNVVIGILAARIATSTANITSATNSIAIGESATFADNNQSNQIVIGFNSQGLGSNTTMIGNTSTITTAIRGRLILGGTTDSGLYQLDVNGTARVTGTGTTSSTTALLVRNSTGTFNCLKVRDDGKVAFGNSGIDCTITGTTGSGNKFEFYAFNGYDITDGFGNTLITGLGSTIRLPREVGVGFNAQNNSSAVLQADSTTKGFLPPRMTTTQINAIATPAEGLQVYNTTINHMCFYMNGAWAKLTHSPM